VWCGGRDDDREGRRIEDHGRGDADGNEDGVQVRRRVDVRPGEHRGRGEDRPGRHEAVAAAPVQPAADRDRQYGAGQGGHRQGAGRGRGGDAEVGPHRLEQGAERVVQNAVPDGRGDSESRDDLAPDSSAAGN
jgi:hypothetical protein